MSCTTASMEVAVEGVAASTEEVAVDLVAASWKSPLPLASTEATLLLRGKVEDWVRVRLGLG